jgi:hypothetical protein
MLASQVCCRYHLLIDKHFILATGSWNPSGIIRGALSALVPNNVKCDIASVVAVIAEDGDLYKHPSEWEKIPHQGIFFLHQERDMYPCLFVGVWVCGRTVRCKCNYDECLHVLPKFPNSGKIRWVAQPTKHCPWMSKRSSFLRNAYD